MNSHFQKIAVFISRPKPYHPANTDWPRRLYLTVLILLLGLVLVVQSNRAGAQGIRPQAGDFVQAMAMSGEPVIARETINPSDPVQKAAQGRVTRTPRPTATPPVIPPPADPTSTNLMILLAAVILAVILIGIWINRSRTP